MTTTFDATPMTASPTGLPTLPTGTFGLPISAPSTKQQTCLVNSAQASSWSCNIAMTTPYTISISELPNASSNLANNEVSLSYGNNSFGGWYAYGAQPPVLMSSKVLNLVIDSQDPSSGPAWFFEMTYDKVVILPPNAFTPSANSKRKEKERHNDKPFGEFTGRKNVLQPGDKPWFCYWNGTLLETFIYVSSYSLRRKFLSNKHSGKQDQQRWRPAIKSNDGFVCSHVNKQSRPIHSYLRVERPHQHPNVEHFILWFIRRRL
jgi:hypothetical protein